MRVNTLKFMLILSLRGKEAAIRAAIKRHRSDVDAIEWRLDLIEEFDLSALAALKKEADLPSIFTLRSPMTREKEGKLLEALTLNPTYLDLAWDTPLPFVNKLSALCPSLQLISSYHNFVSTPTDLEAIFRQISRFKVAFIKIATTARSSLDALRMLHFTLQKKEEGIPFAGMCMGKLGEITRILAPIAGSYATYASAEEGEETALGQLTVDTLTRIYNVKDLKKDTPIYALIGKPIEHSLGHLCHNGCFHHFGKAGVYVKIEIAPSELSRALELMYLLPFCGVSITMPLKEAILPYLDSLDAKAQKMGAINTLVRKEGKWVGYNTDAKGALDALEKKGKVKGKRVLILGAGGVARAIAFEAISRGGEVIILNRTREKGKKLARHLGVEGEGLSACGRLVQKRGSIVINATSVGMDHSRREAPIDPSKLPPKTVVFDVVTSTRETHLLKEAKKRGCICIEGDHMYARQAAEQLALWMGDSFPKEEAIQTCLRLFRKQAHLDSNKPFESR